MKALILAATKGNHLEPITATRPKAMVPVGGKPLLEFHLRECHGIGVTRVDVVTGHKSEEVSNYFGSGEEFGVDLHYIQQTEQKGIGQALLLAKDRFSLPDYFALCYADHVTDASLLSQVFSLFSSFHAPIAAVTAAPSTGSYGNVYLGGDTRISKIVEKPDRKDLGNYVLAGCFILPTEFFSLLEFHQGSMVAALEALIATRGLYASIWGGQWLDVDYPWNVLTGNQIRMDTWTEARISKSANIEGSVRICGPVHIEEGVTIKAGSFIEGPCFIGRNSFIGNNTLVRKYTSIGPDSLIGFGVELKNCVLMGRTTLGRLSFIGDSVCGRNVNLGSGVMTVNENLEGGEVAVPLEDGPIPSGLDKLGALIGDDSIIGASNTLGPGTLLPAGTRIPHNLSQLK